VPVVPVGHFGFSLDLQFGGVPVVPVGHGFFGGSTQRLPVHSQSFLRHSSAGSEPPVTQRPFLSRSKPRLQTHLPSSRTSLGPGLQSCGSSLTQRPFLSRSKPRLQTHLPSSRTSL